MTNNQHGQVPAIRRYKIGYHSDEWGVRSLSPTGIYDDAGPWVRYEDHAAVITALRTTHVQNPAEIEHVAGDVSKNSTEKNVTVYAELPQSVGEHRYGGGLYTDAQMRAFADATHALRAQLAALAAGQAPAGTTEPTEQQILEAAEKAGLWPNTVHSWIPAFHRYHKELAKAQPAPAQAADSVQEDAARYRWLREGNDAKHGAAWHVAVNLYGCEWDAAIDAARKQGANHDR